MEMIPSFCVDHDTLNVGLYISRIDKDIVTFDLRMVKPNAGKYLDNNGLHTFEHLFATYVRNSPFQDDVIYVGPMGCELDFILLFENMWINSRLLHSLSQPCNSL